MSQSTALYLTKPEAERLLAKARRSRFLQGRAIEVYTVDAEPMAMHDGTHQPAVRVMVRAETDMACGMGVGWLTVVSEGAI